jgi:hypothetical protein
MRTVEMADTCDSGDAERTRYVSRSVLVFLLWLAIALLVGLFAFLTGHLAARRAVVAVVLLWVGFGCVAFALVRVGRRTQQRIRPSGPGGSLPSHPGRE